MTAGTSAALTDTAATIFDTSASGDNFPGCQSYNLKNPSTSNDDALIHVTPIHKTGEWFPIEAGDEKTFTCRHQRITKVEAKCVAGRTVTVKGGILVM